MALVVGLLIYSRKCRVPHTPDFLFSLIEPANFMRLSLMKAAHAALALRTGNPGISLVFPRCGMQRTLILSLSGMADPVDWNAVEFHISRKTSEILGTRDPWSGQS